MAAYFDVPEPVNEPVLDYRVDSAEWASLSASVRAMSETSVELPALIGGHWRMGEGRAFHVVEPHRHANELGFCKFVSSAQANAGIDAALEASWTWRGIGFEDRAAVFLRAAELLSGPWRDVINAATMLGQSKTVYQSEIDAACELADFWRFNVAFARQILMSQPATNGSGVWNRTEHRPLEGFVYAVSPFNFTSIAANLACAPALMGNVVVWKPSPTQQLSAHYTMQLLAEAGLPPGVVNLLPGEGAEVSAVAMTHPLLAGVHFTGSTGVFHHLASSIAAGAKSSRSYPRMVGETGGKGFVLAHPSADPEALITAIIRGAFDYQGQKCSAASRAYIPRSLWAQIRDDLIDRTESLRMGDPSDSTNFMGAVIDARSFTKQVDAIDRARAVDTCVVIAGSSYDDSVGHFVRPTIVEGDDPRDEFFWKEYFGPILGVHVFEDGAFDEVAERIARESSYALTGALFARDRLAIVSARAKLVDAAGNFYINDKPTGAVVGQQPFGGGRASGTNDKAGSPDNLKRWTSPRSIKENLNPPLQHAYAHQDRTDG